MILIPAFLLHFRILNGRKWVLSIFIFYQNMKKLKNEELNRLSVEEFKNHPKVPVVLILDNVRSMNNVGSAFRTADAFTLEKIYLCGITGRPPHRDINKTALGATDSVAWEYSKDAIHLVKQLKAAGYRIIVIEQADKSCYLNRYCPQDGKLALIFGNEISGVQEEVLHLADDVTEIPQFGTKHSLNISVSIGIVVWDVLSKLKIIKD
jgi:23S rRNA (guanosine2251-2'-O)-methyltransferase